MPGPALMTRWETSEVSVSVSSPMTVQVLPVDCAFVALAMRSIRFAHCGGVECKRVFHLSGRQPHKSNLAGLGVRIDVGRNRKLKSRLLEFRDDIERPLRQQRRNHESEARDQNDKTRRQPS